MQVGSSCLCQSSVLCLRLFLNFPFLHLLLALFLFLHPIRSYCTCVPFWQWKSIGRRKRWPICWMMQWTHTSPTCRVCLWEWSTLRSWTLTSCWRSSKNILLCVLLRYVWETPQAGPLVLKMWILGLKFGQCKTASLSCVHILPLMIVFFI